MKDTPGNPDPQPGYFAEIFCADRAPRMPKGCRSLSNATDQPTGKRQHGGIVSAARYEGRRASL
jgi:hypothetical protein